MSVLIVPCHIRSAWDRECLRRLLDSVLAQTLRFDRVVLVDDASLLPLDVDHRSVTCLHLSNNGGPAKARNAGIEEALGSGAGHLLFTDHDCVLDPRWNEQMTAFLETSPFGAVGGMTYALGTTLLDYYHDINGTLNGKWLLPGKEELWYMPSLNFGMNADVAREYNFDERFPTAAGEDVDLSLRIRSKYKIGFCPRARLWHDFGYRSTIRGLPRFIKLFMKYKSSTATLYDGHTVLMWDSSESIYKGNAHESGL